MKKSRVDYNTLALVIDYPPLPYLWPPSSAATAQYPAGDLNYTDQRSDANLAILETNWGLGKLNIYP
jgi:hypothetical protein